MKITLTTLLIWISWSGIAQKTNQCSWQQQCDFKIDVTLNPSAKTLSASMSMLYQNHSPDTLKSIFIHVWPNAYSSLTTDFALQQLKNNRTDFQFSDENEKGYIEELNFMTGKDTLKWHYDSLHKDILEINLDQPLLPGSQISIHTPFLVKLPKIFSRSGFKGSFFAITQWYPKPAVYDVNGWNTMPYLDQGEFYSEFGDYEVNITLPEKYLVAATGNLQTLSEIRLLDSLVAIGGNGYNNHSDRLKTLTFKEQHIHDFAWFTDTLFRVNSSFVKLDNGDTVKTWMFIGKEKKKTYYKGSPMKAVNDAITSYSKRIGNYPYKQCTVVIGPITAGSGMEYPTITVCEQINYGLIKHEVGHNWFYGILGSNERRYPWMDESINTFYEGKMSGSLKGDTTFYRKFKGRNWLDNYETLTGYLFSARQGISQPLNLSSEDFSGLNYGSIVYCKGPLLFAYLEQQLGDSVFEVCMQIYFREWQFRHPLPGDMQKSFEQSCGKKLDWFFNDLMNENNTIDIINTNSGFKVIGSEKLDSFLKENKINKPNPFGFLPETNYRNNGQKLKLITLGIPFQLPRQNSRIPLNMTPVGGYNYYDKLYLGAAIYNRTLFREKFEYVFMPAYAIGTKKMVGYGQINYLFFSKSKRIFKTEAGIQGQTFGISASNQINQYFRINPYVRFHFKHKGKINESIDKQLLFNFYHTGLQNASYVAGKDSTQNDITRNFPANYFYNYYKLTYLIDIKHPINAFTFRVNMEYGYNYKFDPQSNQYLKTWINGTYKYTYGHKNKFFKTELFAGLFIDKKGNNQAQEFYLSGNNGNRDYQYNEAMLGRSENTFSENILGRQIISTNGNMRNTIPYSSTNLWMLSSCNEVCLPGIIPIRLYADFGYYPYNKTSATPSGNVIEYFPAEIYTTAGIILPLFKETLEIFVPLYRSKQFLQYTNYDYSFVNSIGFKLNLNKLHPFKLLDNYRP